MKDIRSLYIAATLVCLGIAVFVFRDQIPTLGGISISQALIAAAVGGSFTAVLSYFGLLKQNKTKSDKNT